MTTFRRQRGGSADPDLVVVWRVQRLRGVGFPAALADAIARDVRYDLHHLLGLIDRGCPPELAARILAPLENRADG
jgi:hypothetical protein